LTNIIFHIHVHKSFCSLLNLWYKYMSPFLTVDCIVNVAVVSSTSGIVKTGNKKRKPKHLWNRSKSYLEYAYHTENVKIFHKLITMSWSSKGSSELILFIWFFMHSLDSVKFVVSHKRLFNSNSNMFPMLNLSCISVYLKFPFHTKKKTM
jgi:hypothetical protein